MGLVVRKTRDGEEELVTEDDDDRRVREFNFSEDFYMATGSNGQGLQLGGPQLSIHQCYSLVETGLMALVLVCAAYVQKGRKPAPAKCPSWRTSSIWDDPRWGLSDLRPF